MRRPCYKSAAVRCFQSRTGASWSLQVTPSAKLQKKVLSTLGISGGDDKKFIATPETWLVSPDHSENHSTDVFDVAIDSLSIDQVLKLNGASFVRIADVSFARDLRQNYFVIIGYPNIWSTVSISDHELVELRPLQYGTDAYSGSKAGLEDYDERFHLLLNARPGGLLDQSGKAVRFRTRTGFPADLPQDLQGISGCSVWSIGDPRKVPTEWSPSGSRLVGVQTGFFSGCGAIKATRWNAVTTLLHSACPDLRPVLELYERI